MKKLTIQNSIFQTECIHMSPTLLEKCMSTDVFLCSKKHRSIYNIQNYEIVNRKRGIKTIKVHTFKQFIHIEGVMYYVIANYKKHLLLLKCKNYSELNNIWNKI